MWVARALVVLAFSGEQSRQINRERRVMAPSTRSLEKGAWEEREAFLGWVTPGALSPTVWEGADLDVQTGK